jgi:hypothetical protein
MDIFYEPHKVFLIKMLKAKVDFMLIGGYAVNFYGYNRPTGDMDLWLKPDNTNRDKFITILLDEDFEEEDIEIIRSADFTKPMVFHVGQSPYRIDFMNFIANVQYEHADLQKTIAEVDGLHLPIIHFNDLIRTKEISSRLKDKADVEELKKINKDRI